MGSSGPRRRRGRWAAAVLGVALLAPLTACRSHLAIAMEVARQRNAVLAGDPRREHFFVRDPATGRPLEEVDGLFTPDGTFVRDGAQRTWWPNGALQDTRTFANDEPRGLWTRFWRTGTLRMVHEHDPLRPTPMVLWHPNGIVAAEGDALCALRVGSWIERWPNGVVRAEGEYAAGLETGEWIYRDLDGRVVARGRYRGGARVGPWSMGAPEGGPGGDGGGAAVQDAARTPVERPAQDAPGRSTVR